MNLEISNSIYYKPNEFSLWLRALALSQFGKTNITSPWHSKIDIYPHQIETVIKAINMKHHSLILADEVGLGKTIEAGMIIKELIKRGEIKNFLIIPPASLVNQWHQEMFHKFDLSCEIINRSNISEILENEIYGGYVVSIDFAKYNMNTISNFNWDIVIFDEAHHLRKHFSESGYYNKTKKYELGEALKDKTSSFLFLTATPFQLNDFEFFSLIQLLNSKIFNNYEHFKYYRETYLPKINEILNKLLNKEDCLTEAKILAHRLNTNYPNLFQNNQEIKENNLINILKESNIISKYLIRHKKRIEFPNSPPREVSTIEINYTKEEKDIYTDVSTYAKTKYNEYMKEGRKGNGFVMVIFQQLLASSPKALLKTVERRIERLKKSQIQIIGDVEYDEEEYEDRELELVEELPLEENVEDEIKILEKLKERLENLKKDSKLEVMIHIISDILIRNPNEKIIIFTKFIETQNYIKNVLSEHFKVAVFNGKLTDEEKNKEIEKFKKTYKVLISTEAGGEGRNLQFSHIMVNYDLPWNPVKLEQRIGRIDRIGQNKTVIVNNLSTLDTIEQKILDVLTERILDFEDLIGPTDPIIGSIEKDLTELLMKQKKLSDIDAKIFETTIDEKIKRAKSASKNFDNLMIFEKLDRDKTELMKQNLNKIDENKILDFVIQSVNRIKDAYVKKLKENIFEIKLPKEFGKHYSDRIIVGTFLKSAAMENENLEFLTSDHWLINELIDMWLKEVGVVISGDISRENRPYIDMIFKCKRSDNSKFINLRFFNNNEIKILDNYEIFSGTKKDADNKILNKIFNNISVIKSLKEKSIIYVNKALDFDVEDINLVGVFTSNFDRW